MSSELQPEPFSVVRGEGFPIVFAHGMGIDHRSMMMLDDAFPEGTKRIYTINAKGFDRLNLWLDQFWS